MKPFLSALCCSFLFAPLPLIAQEAAPKIQIVEDVESQFDLRCTVKRKASRNEKSAANFAPAKVLLGYQKSSPNYLVLIIAPDELRLSRVQNGNGKVIARAQKFYEAPSVAGRKMVLQWRSGKLAVLYGNRVLLQQENLGGIEGAVALQASDDISFSEAQLQPTEPVYFADDFMRMNNSDAHSWESAHGEWKINAAANPIRVANAFTYSGTGDAAISLAGRWFWNDYTVSSAVRPLENGEVGLVVYYQDDKNYLLFKWLGGIANGRFRGQEKQLWRVWNGQAALIASAPGGYRAKQWYRLSAGVENDVFTASIDDQTVLQSKTNLFGQGRAGLYENGAATIFDDVFIYGHDNREATEKIQQILICPQFTKEESMSNWASVKSEWSEVNKDGAQTFWHRGTFFGDHHVNAQVSGLYPNGKAKIILNGDGETPTNGYALEVTRPDDKHLKAVLLRDGTPQKEAQIETNKDNYDVSLQRFGTQIRGSVGDLKVAFQDKQPLKGRRAGFSAQNARIERENAHAEGSQVHDYTFYQAPTDWIANRGEWDISSRWLCTKDWAWYGGKSDNLATLWNKREFTGDYTIDVFAACQMDNDNAPFYNHPRDLNITVSGDGDDPASGYSFVFGGWNNQFTRILRGAKTVAETKEILLPAQYHNEAHHKWFHLRVEKKGEEFSYFIDEKLALTYRDKNPLPGKHIALWTAGNGMMIARATIYYEKESGIESVLPPLREAIFAPAAPVEKMPWKVRGAEKSVNIEAVPTPTKDLAVRAISNSGGEFSIAPQLESFDAFQTSKLSFDCRIAPRTAVNLYLKARDKFYSIRLSGPTSENEREDIKSLGAAPILADDQWHSVALDLAALFKPLYPDAGELKIDEIFLGNLPRDPYQKMGFDGNAPGSEYQVRAFTLRGGDNRIAKLFAPELKAAPLQIAEVKPEIKLVRGLMQMRVTFCEDNDGGAFKDEMLNKPIAWKAFSKPIFTEPVKAIDFAWPEQKSPGAGIRSTYWSARFYGKVQVAAEGDYIFSLDRLDDGGRLLIDGKPVLEAWKIQQPATHNSEAIHLSAGLHDLRLDYCQGPGNGSLALSWKGPGFDKEIIPVVEQK